MKSDLQTQLASHRPIAPAGTPVTQCPFCPFRWLRRTGHILGHITRWHIEDNRFCPSGSKQFRVVGSLFDSHQVMRTSGDSILRESALLLRSTIVPALPHTTTNIDEDIRLVFYADGPRYRGLDFVQNSSDLRRCANFYYTLYFAQRFLHEIIEVAPTSVWQCDV